VSGVWKDLTESVNQMAGNLTARARDRVDPDSLQEVLDAVARSRGTDASRVV
jgi:hypothetical protein